jgi:Protein of unknown function (DUF3175)
MPPRKARPKARKAAHRTPSCRWSARVTRNSDALDLEGGVFSLKDPKRIAASLKRSAQRSTRKKSGSFRSALSMLTFYINRAGKNLSAGRRKTLQQAKDELRKQFKRA